MLPFLSQFGVDPPSNAVSFVPRSDPKDGPFEEFILWPKVNESDPEKCLVVNMQDKRLTIKNREDSQSGTRRFVISKVNI